MSAAAEEDEKKEDFLMKCASCGVVANGEDGVKLKNCACKLVKYCSVKCQKDHRKHHKNECKKRVDELRDEIIFKQPESTHVGDCPICCLPIPIDQSKSNLYPCCCKLICQGCNYVNQKREYEGRLEHKCPFCREPLADTAEEFNGQMMKRIEANDPTAISHIGTKRYHEGDYKSALEYWTKAVALGDVEAHNQLSALYGDGKGVEKDVKKEFHHLTEAAIGGDHCARYNLGTYEWKNGRVDRAVKHYIIAAKLGFDASLERLNTLHRLGHVSKEDFEAALRGHKAAIDATKSPEREEAAKSCADGYERRIV